MRTRASTLVACLLAGLMAAGPPQPAVAQPADPEPPVDRADDAGEPGEMDDHEARVAAAREHYQTGQELFEQQRYREAAYAFERSYDAIAAPDTLYNVAISYELAELPVEALPPYVRYLESLPPESEERGEIERSVARLRAQVGELDLDIPDGVEVTSIAIDGQPVAREEFPRLARPGPVALTIRGGEDHEVMETTVDLVAGKSSVVTVQFPPEPGPVPPPKVTRPDPRPAEPTTPPIVDDRRRRALRGAFWTSFALTVASGASIGVLGGLTLRERDAFNDAKCADPCPSADEDDPSNMEPEKGFPFEEEDRFNSFKLATNVMVGVTAALGVTTIVLGVLAYRKGARSSRRARSPSLRTAGPGVVVRW